MNKKRENLYDKQAAGRRIRDRRKGLNLSPEALAEKLGLSEKYLMDIERGTCSMSLETALKLAWELGFTLNYLIYGEPYPSPFPDVRRILAILSDLPERKRKTARRILLAYLEGEEEE